MKINTLKYGLNFFYFDEHSQVHVRMKRAMTIHLRRSWIVARTNYTVTELHLVMDAQVKMYVFHEGMITWEIFVKVFALKSVKKTTYIVKFNQIQ